MRGVGEGLGDFVLIAVVIIECDIARYLVIEQRRTRFRRIACAYDRRQRLDVEGDGFSGILGLDDSFRDHAGDRIADETYLVAGERRAWPILDRGTIAMIGSPASRGAVASVARAGRACLAVASAVSAVSATIAASVTMAREPQNRIAMEDRAVVNRFIMPCPG
jgi:hypothetical protein